MKCPVTNLDGKQVGEVDLSDAIFAVPVRKDFLHASVRWQMARSRSGTAKTKGRSELSYSRRKMFRQKGTGNARRGDRRTNILRGGGTMHGPRPRSYEHGLPKQMRRAALKAALSSKAASDDLYILDSAVVPEIKTRDIAKKFNQHGWNNALFLEREENADTKFLLSVRNLPQVRVLPSVAANVRDILAAKSLVVTRAALEDLEARLS